MTPNTADMRCASDYNCSKDMQQLEAGFGYPSSSFYMFPTYLYANSGILLDSGITILRPVSSRSFSTHHSPVILTFGAIRTKKVTALINNKNHTMFHKGRRGFSTVALLSASQEGPCVMGLGDSDQYRTVGLLMISFLYCYWKLLAV